MFRTVDKLFILRFFVILFHNTIAETGDITLKVIPSLNFFNSVQLKYARIQNTLLFPFFSI